MFCIPRIKNPAIVAVGAVYGFFGGIIGTGGVIKAALLVKLGLRNQEFISTMAASALLINVIKIIIYSGYSLFAGISFYLYTALFLCAFIGAFIGKSAQKRINPSLFKNVVFAILFLIAIKLILF